MGQMQFPAGIMILNAAIQIPLSAVHFGLGRLTSIGHCWCCGVCGDLRSAGVSADLSIDCQRPVRHLRRSAMTFSRKDFADILQVALPGSSPYYPGWYWYSPGMWPVLVRRRWLLRHWLRAEFLIIPLVFGLGSAMTSVVGVSVSAKDL